MSGTQNPNGTDTASLDDLKEIMQFDPFGPASDTGSGTDGGQDDDDNQNPQDPSSTGEHHPEGEDDSGNAPAGESSPASGDTDTSKQAPSGGEDKDRTIEALRGQIATLLAQPQAPQQQPAQQAKPKEGQPSGEAEPDPNPYKFQIAQELVDGINSDEPQVQRAAVSALANSVMNKLYQDFSSALKQLEQRIMQTVPQVLEQHQTTKTVQQQIEDDFYGTYPELKSPLLREAVWNTVGQIAQRLQVKEWNEELRDAAGTYLLQQLGIQRQAGQQQQQQQQTAGGGKSTKQPRRTFAAGSGAGGGGNRSGNDDGNQFADVLNVGGF